MLFDKIINTAFSFGAAIVIFGAWGKIEHKEFGSTALTAGLLTETAIFCIYGVLEWRKKPGELVDGLAAGAGTLEEQGTQADRRGGSVGHGGLGDHGEPADRRGGADHGGPADRRGGAVDHGGPADRRGGAVDHGGPADRRGGAMESGAAPVKQEQVEALTDSIRQASQVLTKIFRV